MQLIFEKRVSFSLKLKLVKNVIQESIWIWIGGNTAIKDGLLRFTTVQNFYRSFEFDGHNEFCNFAFSWLMYI